jgi:hypothetical protein
MQANLDQLTAFVRRRAKLGKLGANSAQSYLTSIERVFDVATDAEKADVLGANLDILFERFRKHADLERNTMASYEGRVKAAINNYLKYVRTGEEREPTDEVAGDASALIIPLRSGSVSISGLPNDLTEAEARKVAGVIMAMAS